MKLRFRHLLALAALLAAAPAAGAPDRMECGRLVPASALARYLRGATLHGTGGSDRTLECDAVLGDRLAAEISFRCRPNDTRAKFVNLMRMKRRRAVGGLGRAAFGDERRVAFWDDNADCQVEVRDHLGSNAIALAKDVSAALRPDLLPLPKARLMLSCERLLPDRLRSKWAQGSTVKATYSQANQMNCELEMVGRMPIWASYTCRGGSFDATYWSRFRRKLPKASAAESVRVGTGGVYWRAGAAHTVRFADGETGCLVSITTFEGDKRGAIAFAADVERALTQESAR